jgi:GGDEF domain-containing protein
MASAQHRSGGVIRDRTNLAWALGGLAVVALVTVAFNGVGVSSAFAIAVAAAYGLALSTVLLRRNTRHWRRLLARIEHETRRRLLSTEQATSFSTRFFLERLAQECHRSRRYGLDLSVIRLRCDAQEVARLGSGDDAGVAVVTAAAERLCSEDVVGRLSVLEFAFFLPHTDRAGAEVVLERLGALEALIESLGLAVFGDDAADVNGLLRAAGARGWNQRALVR